MATDNFDEVNRQLEEIAAKLKTSRDPIVRRTLLPEMSRLLLGGQFKPGQRSSEQNRPMEIAQDKVFLSCVGLFRQALSVPV